MTVTALSPAKISNTGLPEEWKFIGSDGVIYRRFEFENYTATSAFLDRLAELSKEIGLYPDLSFAKTYDKFQNLVRIESIVVYVTKFEVHTIYRAILSMLFSVTARIYN